MKKIIICSFLVAFLATSCTNASHSVSTAADPIQSESLNPAPDRSKTDNPIDSTYYPFLLRASGGKNTIFVELESQDNYAKYYALFHRYGYEGNGTCWEGHIEQILTKLDPGLRKHIGYDCEAGSFLAYTDTKENQQAFLKWLVPIFRDTTQLASWIAKADHAHIDD